MTLRRLVIVALLAAGMGLYVVIEHARIRRAEFEVCRLSDDATRMKEHRRELKLEVAQMKDHDFIEAQVKRLQIDLMKLPDENGPEWVEVAGR